MKQIKLQVGKTYLSRNGLVVKIIKNDGTDEYQFKGSNGEWYAENGKWGDDSKENPEDLIEEVPETRHTFDIPDGVKRVTVEQVGNRIIVEMVPEKEPKPGDVLVNTNGNVYILKEVIDCRTHDHYARLGKGGRLFFWGACYPGRPATPEEAQPLWDALKKAGKKWDPEAMKVVELPEIERILEWVETNIKDGYYNHEDVAEAIEAYLNYKEGEK